MWMGSSQDTTVFYVTYFGIEIVVLARNIISLKSVFLNTDCRQL